MQVLKFGGTSVASAENIRKSLAIVVRAAAKGPVVMVVSALGGTTDALIGAGRAAAYSYKSFREDLSHLEERHVTAAHELLKADASPAITLIRAQFDELKQLCNGIFCSR